MAETKILVAKKGKIAQIRVIGRGNYENSAKLREFGTKQISEGCNLILVDLTECTSMDSTFMGTLALLARPQGGTEVELVNVNEQNQKLLEGLGIKRIFSFSHTTGTSSATDWQTLVSAVSDSGEISKARLMLEATEELVRIDPQNQPKFEDVITFLKEDIDRLSSAGE